MVRPRARDGARGQSPDTDDWCGPCAAAGQYVLAAEAALCTFHARRGATSHPGPSGPDRGRARRRAHGRARARAYGRHRAACRVAAGRWDPHPAWRNRIGHGLMVLTDQRAALRRVEQLVDAQDWRTDRRQRWTAMLRRLVHAMDWSTGLVAGVTREQLAAAAGGRCSVRTVSRLLEWAQGAGLLVVVECGAAAAFLGTDRNRAPSYVLVAKPAPAGSASPPVSGPVEASGNLPTGSVDMYPLPAGGRRLDHPTAPSWPSWQTPDTAGERNAAVSTLLARIGLDGRRVPVWRARALLCRWWHAGACVAGLLHAIDHSPDGTARGDALRSARDPLRVLGHRLAAWTERLDQLPAHLHGRRGDYRAEQAARIAERTAAAQRPTPRRPASTAEAREAARAQLAELLAARRGRAAAPPADDAGHERAGAGGRSGRREQHVAGTTGPAPGARPGRIGRHE